MFCHQCGTPAEVNATFCVKCGAVLKNELSTQATTMQTFSPPDEKANITTQAQLADRATRLGAAILDDLILLATLAPGGIVILLANTTVGDGLGWALVLMAYCGLVIVQLVFLVQRGQSIGKLALGIRIVRVDNGNIPGFVKVVLLRSWVLALITAIPYVGAVIVVADGLFIFRDDRRCLHDLIAGTRVVKVKESVTASIPQPTVQCV